MNHAVKTVYHAWYEIRRVLGLKTWYHSVSLCQQHFIPRTHRVDFMDENHPRGILLCQKGPRDYFTDEPIQL